MDISTKLNLLSAAFAGLFAGAALYINLVEHPVRSEIPIKNAHVQWQKSYARAAKLQASLAGASFLTALVNRFRFATKNKELILTAGLLIGSVIPFTLLVILPTNKILLNEQTQISEHETKGLLSKWGQLHAVRTVASLASFAILLYTLSTK